MVYIVSHTRDQYTGPGNGRTKIRVYSNCGAVELFVNGKTAGKLEKQGVYLWDVALKEGTNTMHAVGISPTRTVEDRVQVRYVIR
jgi:beta-galactosidase